MRSPGSRTLAAELLARCASTPDRTAVSYLDSSGHLREQLTYQELVDGARRAAYVVQDCGAGGGRVVLVARPHPEFLEWFFGCLFAGAVPVPAPPSTGRHRMERLRTMIADARASAVVGRLSAAVRTAAAGVPVLAPDSHRDATPAHPDPTSRPDALAMLQYTSGSTRTPRGVMLTQEGMLHNIGQIGSAFRLGPEDRALIWLPPHHDMGLIGGLLAPLLVGFPTMVLDPAAFARRPLLWLEAVSRYGATVSGGPNTAYEMAARDLEDLPSGTSGPDLTSWSVAFVGAEPVQARTLRRFADRAARYGFRRTALRPCYGLAEATLLVSAAGEDGARTAGPPAQAVSSGSVVRDTRVRIVDPRGNPCPPGVTGEIWVSGPGVGTGYWGAPDETDEVFGGRLADDPERYLRTGDLGHLDDASELVPTGRMKDLLILNGRNVYPADLELAALRAVEPHPCGLAAAFPLTGEPDFAVLVEVPETGADLGAILLRARTAVAAEAQHPPAVVGVVRTGTLPRTTSGKIQRSRVRDLYLAGELRLLREVDVRTVRSAALARATAFRASVADLDFAGRAALVERYLRSRLQAVGHPPGGTEDNRLSELGVDSVTVLSLVEELDLVAGARLPRTELLADDSLAAIAAVTARDYSAAPQAAAPVAAPPPGQWHAATPGEAAMFMLESMVPGGTNIVAACHVEGEFDTGTVRRAVAALVARHESLRTRYHVTESGVQRRVEPSTARAAVTTTDAQGWSDSLLRSWVQRSGVAPFALDSAPLLRVDVLARGARRHVVVLSVPHLVADFRSMTVLFTDLLSGLAGVPLDLAATPYRSHVARVGSFLTSPAARAARDHFAERLAGARPGLSLPGRHRAGTVGGGAAAELRTSLDAATARRVTALARQERTSPFVVLLSIYQALLHHQTGQVSVTVGVPVLGRDAPDAADTVGLFMNQLPVVSRPSAATTLRDLVRTARNEVRACLDYQLYPLERIVAEASDVRGGAGGLFETMFLLHRTRPDQPAELAAFEVADGAEVNLGTVRCRSLPIPRVRDTLPLTVVGAEVEGSFRFVFRYLTDHLPEPAVARLAESFVTLCGRLLDEPDRAFLTVDLGPAPRSAVPRDTLVDRLRQIAVRHPARSAIVSGDRDISYARLWAGTGRGANALARLGVQAGDLVGILHDRHEDALILTYAVLRAGAGYVHLDHHAPPERLRRILDGSGVRLLVADAPNAAVARELGVPTAAAAVILAGDESSEPAPPLPGPDDVAYVSFTSGSSGQPKGVVVTQRGALAAVDAFADTVALGPTDVVCAVSSLSWDIVVGDMLAAPMRGATLCLAADDALVDGAALAALLDRALVTVMSTTPHRWKLLLDTGWRPPAGFRAVCGGDVMTAHNAELFDQVDAHVWNFYGPTETVLWSTALNLREWHGGDVPIGRPLPGYRVRTANAALGPTPPGATGELLIGGATVARGYLNDPRLTARRFVPDPSGVEPGARLYRTGDLVRIDDLGRLLFVGRADSQVKLRGYRFETGDVETALTESASVSSAVVAVVGEDAADAQLVAFVVPADGMVVNQRELLGELATKLPRYMIPNRVVSQPLPPLNSNGKVDRSVLSTAALPPADTSTSPPLGPTERIVAEVFGAVLDGGRPGRDDDFFLLGGHSLTAVRAVGLLRTRTGRPVSVRALFERPSVRALAAHLDQLPSGPSEPIAPSGPVGPPGTVTPGQRRLWFDDLAGAGHGMLLPFLVELRGPVRPDLVRAAFDQLVERHESLRTQVVTVDGEPRQQLGPTPVLVVAHHPGGRADQAREQAHRRLDDLLARPWRLSEGPLLRGELVVVTEDHALLLLVVHHMIFDGWSAGVLLGELRQVYAALLRGTAVALPPLAVGEHAAARLLAGSPPDPAQVIAMVDRIAAAPRLRLPAPASSACPTDGGRPPARKRSATIGAAAHRVARRFQTTPYAVVSTAMLAALRVLCRQDDLVTGLDLAGRDRPEFEGLVGYFGNQLPVRVDLRGVTDFAEAVRRTTAAMADALAVQTVGYELLVAELRRRNALRPGANLFDVKIVHQVTPRQVPATTGGLGVEVLDSGFASPAFPLALWVWEGADDLLLELHHRWDACPADWADDLLDRVVALISAAADQDENELEGLMAENLPAGIPSFDEVRVAPLTAQPRPTTRTRLLGDHGTRVLLAEAGGESAVAWLTRRRDVWREALDETGAVLLRGSGVERPEDLHAATEVVFGQRYATTEHPRQTLTGTVVTPVDYPPEMELFWHNEDSFNHRWPATMAFACARPADRGGHTTLVDGAETLRRLDGPARDRFAAVGVCYVRRFVPGLGLPWQAVYRTQDRDDVVTRCRDQDIEATWEGDTLVTRARRPAVLTHDQARAVWFAQILHWHPHCLDPDTGRNLRAALGDRLPRTCTYGDGEPIPDDVVEQLIQVSRTLEFATAWRRGDLLLVDNRRLAHGRRPYQGRREIMVALGDPTS